MLDNGSGEVNGLEKELDPPALYTIVDSMSHEFHNASKDLYSLDSTY